MTVEFNFSRLKNVYTSALKSLDKTLSFDLNIGKGRFLFMMFLSEEDGYDKDMLFLYMRNTKNMKKIKLYGSHKNGTFKVYINENLKRSFIKELQLVHSGNNFDFMNFLNQINESIPQQINIEDKIKSLRNNRDIISSLNVIDGSDKTVLITDKKVAVGTPRDKTLRKLYMYTNASYEDITELIRVLKKMNRTVAWTTEENRYRESDIKEMLDNLK